MYSPILLTLFLTCLLPCISCINPYNTQYYPKHTFFLYFCTNVALFSICRHVKNKLKFIPVSYEAIVITLAVIMGIIAHYWPQSKVLIYHEIDYNYLIKFYCTITVFWMSYNIDVHSFFKTLPQIMFTAIPIYISTSFLLGYVMSIIVEDWSVTKALMFGVSCTLILPLQIINQLNEYGASAKQLTVILEGESLISSGIFEVIFTLLVAHSAGIVVHWFQFISLLIRWCGSAWFTGYLFGSVATILMQLFYDDSASAFVVILAIPFIVVHFARVTIGGVGLFSAIIAGIMMNKQRMCLSQATDELVSTLWSIVFHFVLSFSYIHFGISITLLAFESGISDDSVRNGIIAYLLECLLRLLTFSVFTPILSRFGYGMTSSNMVVCVWGGLKSPMGFIVPMKDIAHYKDILFIIFISFYLSLIINGTLNNLILKLLGFAELSTTKRINMSNCMRYLQNKRDKCLGILKMDRTLAEVNWLVAREGTTLRHPYEALLSDNEEEEHLISYRFSYCSDCNIEVINEPTKRELKEMAKDAKLRILKAKKISYAQQFEEGAVSKEGLRILDHAVEMAIDSEETSVTLDELFKLFKKRNFMSETVRLHVDESFVANSTVKNRRPRKIPKGQRAYKIHESCVFVIISNLIILVNFGLTFYELSFWDHKLYVNYKYMFTSISTLFQMFYMMELYVKLAAFSFIYPFSYGLRVFFSSRWNVFEFTLVVVGCVDLVIDYVFTYVGKLQYIFHLMIFLRSFRLFRVLILIRYCRLVHPSLARYVDTRSNYHIAVAYELGQAYVRGEEDVLKMLPVIIEHEKIREEVQKRIEEDRLSVVKLLGIVQKDKPWVAIKVKTAQAIRTVLNSIRDTINELKMSGWVDEGEYFALMHRLKDKYKYVSFSLKFVQPNTPEVIFKSVDWMRNDEKIVSYLYENAIPKAYSAGDVICEEGKVSEGIFVLVSGLLKQSYKPNPEALNNLQKYGCLPVVDYLTASGYEKPFTEFIVSGNCVGELSTLTRRVYNCSITAEAYSRLFFLKSSIVHEAIKMSSDPAHGLASRLWRSLSINIVFPVLMGAESLQSITIENIKLALEEAIIPDLSKYSVFEVDQENNIVDDMLLIEGLAADAKTHTTFTAPCFIPRDINRLYLPKSGLLDQPDSIKVDTRLLIVFELHVREFELKEENWTLKLLEGNASGSCLIHVKQHRRRSWQTPNERKMQNIEKQKRRKLDKVTINASHSTSERKSEKSIMKPSSSSYYSQSTLKLHYFNPTYSQYRSFIYGMNENAEEPPSSGDETSPSEDEEIVKSQGKK